MNPRSESLERESSFLVTVQHQARVNIKYYDHGSPEFPRRGEMIEGGQGELLLAVVAVTAMTLTLA